MIPYKKTTFGQRKPSSSQKIIQNAATTAFYHAGRGDI
jgi:hypothetical protein